MNKRGKRGALELSIGTVVIIVLAMSMLILGLVLVKNIFSGAKYNIDQLNDKVTDEINQYLSNLSGYDDYEFFGPISSSRTLIYPPDSGGNWTTNTADNNRYNNSMFDDYISTLAGVYYAIQNFPKLRTDPNSINVTDVYLAHQQGKGGFNSIVREPLLPTTSNMENNYPPPYKKTTANRPKQRQEWYAGWAGNVDGASYRVNPNFTPKSNSDLYVKAKGGSTPDGAIA
jgi:hypothetical protein